MKVGKRYYDKIGTRNNTNFLKKTLKRHLNLKRCEKVS